MYCASVHRSLLCLTATAMLCATLGAAQSEMSTAVREVSQIIAGLERPAEIIIDYWGIPHIYAASKRDMFFLQGYNAARDRLWQIDLWRKRGLGLLAKDFGPDYVAQDRAARLFLYRGDLNQEWAAYGPEAKASADAFAAGINAFVEEVNSGRRSLPVEFHIAGTKPDFWRVEDVVRIRSHALTRNVISEVQRARVACAAGIGAGRLRRKLERGAVRLAPRHQLLVGKARVGAQHDAPAGTPKQLRDLVRASLLRRRA